MKVNELMERLAELPLDADIYIDVGANREELERLDITVEDEDTVVFNPELEVIA